ncbi:MAG: family 43 glycosylhydrolase [Fibrobacterota bacterium]|nr:MAG: family 43 glycosylhydrolase [Fibrobacterota bacterium]
MTIRCLAILALSAQCAMAVNVSFAPYIPWRQTETQPGAHDPTVIRDDRGVYTLMSTNNLLTLWQSTDMVNWSSKGKLLNGVPTWMSSVYSGIENIWAPHLAKMGGKYWVYSCGSVFGKNTSLIGAMSTPTLDVSSAAYKWTDAGEVWRSTTSNDYNAIDPEILVDRDGKAWMSMGSFWQGLRMIAIDPATGKQLASDKTVRTIASRGGGAIEGPSTIQHGSWTYLFAPFDKCCDGINSTYRTMYGRSQSPTGPFVDETGKSMASSGGTQVTASYGRYVGLGGGSPFHDGRRDYFALHYYDRARNGASFLQLREILYDDNGWLRLGQPFLGRHMALEAEHALLSGDSIMTASGSGASNNEYVGYINGATSSVEFLANLLQEGEYWIVVRYAAGDGASSQYLSINGAAGIKVSYPKTSAWGTFPAEQVVVLDAKLKRGRNSLKFSKDVGFAELDRIDIVRKASTVIGLGSFDRFPNASYDSASDGVVLGSGASATYENVGFDAGGFKSMELCAISGTGRVRIGLGSSLSQEVDVAAKGCKTYDLASALQSATGIHDLTITNVSGDLVLGSIQFLTGSSGTAAQGTRKAHTQGARFDPLGREETEPQTDRKLRPLVTRP